MAAGAAGACWAAGTAAGTAAGAAAGAAAVRAASSAATARRLRVRNVVGSTTTFPTGDKSFGVLEPWPSRLVYADTSPFLLTHDWGTPTKRLGAPAVDAGPPTEQGQRHVGWHPHRGFDLLSYIKEGRGSHADSMGNVAVVRPGGIQYMRAGSGIEHAEGGGNPPGVAKHGFQIWINLPAEKKMADPFYGTVQPEDIPESRSHDGLLTRWLAGAGSASFQDRDDYFIADVEVPANATGGVPQEFHVPSDFSHVILYCYQGGGKISGTALRPHHAAVMQVSSSSDEMSVAVGPDGTSVDAVTTPAVVGRPGVHGSNVLTVEATAAEGFGVMVFAGRPLDEPVAWRGPIVMSTQREIRMAYSDLQRGTFLKQRVPFDYRLELTTQAAPPAVAAP